MYWKIGLVVIGCVIGWFVQGWRLQTKLSNLEKEYAQNVAIAYERAKKVETELVKKIEKIERKKNGEIANVNARLRVALSELSERNSRNTINNNPTDCKGTTGRELSREDAEFLTREAARAERLRQALGSCYVQYEAIKSLPHKTDPDKE
jgi:hypothetical protein